MENFIFCAVEMVYFSLESDILFRVLISQLKRQGMFFESFDLIIEYDLIIRCGKQYAPGNYFFIFFNYFFALFPSRKNHFSFFTWLKWLLMVLITVQKMKFSIKHFFDTWDQSRMFLRIWYQK